MPAAVPSSPAKAPKPRFFLGRDGVRLAYREVGEGRPLLLVHGYVSNAWVNWIRFGHAARLAAAGFRVIMPDLRAHGDSARPKSPGAYPPDILADDAFSLVARLGLDDYDLGGYSLGGRTVVRMLARGATPGRAIVAGMGWEGIVDPAFRDRFFERLFAGLGGHRPGGAEWRAWHFVRSMHGDPEALRMILQTSVPTGPAELRAIAVPCLVLLGDRDDEHGSGERLAGALGQGTFASAPGTHMSVVTKPEFGRQMSEFLTRGRPTSAAGRSGKEDTPGGANL
ncbi:MAG TPA: alpha/beta fold hydrolase [Microbacteriaceae bacterium]|nr:alpha/beta fold hydrolase [Microbacteriaceae bacterium]